MRLHTGLIRFSTAAVLAAALTSSMTTTAQAAPMREYTPTPPTMIILDASGSMLESDVPGTRIEAAKDAVRTLVEDLPDSAQVGLQVYGTSTGSAPSDLAKGCQDVKTLVPVGDLDRTAILDAVDSIKASGYTPIGTALRAAADELPAEGPRTIVLVSDGIDTCAPPAPCDVAKELADEGIDLTIHTVGFKVDEAARADLECIADVTEGTYADASDASQLREVLRSRIAAAPMGYDGSGTPVDGSLAATVAGAPVLTPGQWIDTIESPEGWNKSSKYYAIEVPEGWTLHVSATAFFLPDAERHREELANVEIGVRLYENENEPCVFGLDTTGWDSNLGKPISSAVSTECSGTILAEVWRKGLQYIGSDAQVEIIVKLEPPADLSGVPAPEERDIPEPPLGTPDREPLDGGVSFASAAEVTPGQTYTGRIISGEERFYKVPVTWGQQLTYSITPIDRSDSDEPIMVLSGIYDPLRHPYAPEERATWRGPSASGQGLAGGTPEPVRATSELYHLDGDYYLVLSAAQADTPAANDFLITIDTVGEIEQGPRYILPDDADSDDPAETIDAADPAPADSSAGVNGALIALIVAGLLASLLLPAAIIIAIVVARRRKKRRLAATVPPPPVPGPTSAAPPPTPGPTSAP